MWITRGICSCAVLLTLAACGGNSDPLTAMESSTAVDPAQRQSCQQAMTDQKLPSTAQLLATAEATFGGVKSAMTDRYGADKAATLPTLSDDVPVTLCAFDTSAASSTPQVNRAVLAIADGSTWWAAGAVG